MFKVIELVEIFHQFLLLIDFKFKNITVRNLSARAARLYIHCLSVSLDFPLMCMLIAQCLPQNRFVFLRSCFCLPLPSVVASRQLPCGSLRFITLFPVSSFQKTRLRPCWTHAFPRRSVGTRKIAIPANVFILFGCY